MATTNSRPSQQPTHNILLTIPRTASNLLIRLLSLPSQPSISRYPSDGYFFLPGLKYRYQHVIFSRAYHSLTGEEKDGMADALQRSSQECGAWADDAEKAGKGTFIKEHVNWMVDPVIESSYLHGLGSGGEGKIPIAVPKEWLLHKVKPTFLIRHPALTFPSLMRTAIDNEGLEEVGRPETAMTMMWECTYTWHVRLYNYLLVSEAYPYASHVQGITYPIILDARDLQDEALVRRYAQAVGLDPWVVRFEWEEAGRETDGMGEAERRMKDTLLASKGVVKGKLEGGMEMDVDKAKEKWKSEFGEVLAERLAGLVQSAMGDYKWLYARRLHV